LSYGALPSSTTRTAFGEHFSARNFLASVAHLLLFVGEIEIHGALLAFAAVLLVQDDDVFARTVGVKFFYQRGAAFETGALVDVAFISEFVAVDRRRLHHQHRAGDPHAAAGGGSVVRL
jgi:hypothetical protein